MSALRHYTPWLGALAVSAALTGEALAQGNLDAGKSPAQLYGDTCTVCHKNPRALKATSAGFLREHYTTGPQEASAIASYLSGVGSDPKAVQQRPQPGSAGVSATAEPGSRTTRTPPANSPSERDAALPQGGSNKREPPRPQTVVLNHRPSTNAEGSKPATAAFAPLANNVPGSGAGTPHLPEFDE